MANAGFHHAAVIEWNPNACETFRENQRHHANCVGAWPLFEADVRKFDYGALDHGGSWSRVVHRANLFR